jgi:hypothetical protein
MDDINKDINLTEGEKIKQKRKMHNEKVDLVKDRVNNYIE